MSKDLPVSPTSVGIMTPYESTYAASEVTTATATNEGLNNPASKQKTFYNNLFLDLRHLKYDWQRELLHVKDICNEDGIPDWELLKSRIPPSENSARTFWGDEKIFRLPFDPEQDAMIIPRWIVVTNQVQLLGALRFLLSKDPDLKYAKAYICSKEALQYYSDGSDGWSIYYSNKVQ